MSKLIVANWKMALTHAEATTWLIQEYPEVRKVADSSEHELVICPSFTELAFATEEYTEDTWGAQECSEHPLGAYTGQVSALSLTELGIEYCIIGHSEQRRLGQTNASIKQKAALLLSQFITPIICIGETDEQRPSFKNVLWQQLEPLVATYREADIRPLIAYEPVWAIGSGKTPTKNDLTVSLEYIKQVIGELNPQLLYGGSVTPPIAKEFSPLVDGYLVGSASLNPELLKKIILSC